MEDLGDDASPAMEKVDPTVLDEEVSVFLLRLGLAEKEQVAAVVELPDHPVSREDGGVGEGRAWASLPRPVALMTSEPGGSCGKRASL